MEHNANAPQVSILVPCRNSAEHIEQMLDSAIGQSYPKLEVVVQDCLSTDNTAEILDRYPVQWISEPDTGISQAINRALARSRGEIIGIMCADDLIEPGAVAAAVDVFLENPEVVLVYGDCNEIDPAGRPFKKWKSMPFDLDKLCWQCYIPIQTVYIRRSALEKVGGFDESLRLVQDFDLWLRLGCQYPAESFRYLPRVQGAYRVQINSAGMGNPEQSAQCLLRVMSKFLDQPSIPLKKGRNQAFAGLSLLLVVYHLMGGKRLLALRAFCRALFAYPFLVCRKKGLMTIPQVLLGDRLRRTIRRLEQVAG